MDLNLNKFLDLIFKVGSLAGLLAIIYQIHNNRKNRPLFSFTFEGSFAKFFKEDKIDYCDYHFHGIIRNTSLKPNTIVRLYLTVWNSKKKGSVLRYGHGVKKLINLGGDEKLTLPLRFDVKQAYKLEAIFNFPISGTGDKKILEATIPFKTNLGEFQMPKYKYEFLIEDVCGNLFDHRSSVMNKELIDLWWTLGNYSKNPVSYFKQCLKIASTFAKWKISKLVEAIGFYR